MYLGEWKIRARECETELTRAILSEIERQVGECDFHALMAALCILRLSFVPSTASPKEKGPLEEVASITQYALALQLRMHLLSHGII